MTAILIALIICITTVACMLIGFCGDAISTYIDNTIVMIENNRENCKLREEVHELQNEIERLKGEM